MNCGADIKPFLKMSGNGFSINSGCRSHLYGKTDVYLIREDLKYFFMAAGLALVVLAIVVFVFKMAPPGFAGLAALVGIVSLLFLVEPLMKWFEKKSMQFYRGFSGQSRYAVF